MATRKKAPAKGGRSGVVARMHQADGVIHEVMVEREHVAEARRTLDWRGATADWLTCPVRIREVRP